MLITRRPEIQGNLAELQSAFQKFDLLSTEQSRLAGEVAKIAQQEAELLRDESLSEVTATKRLIETRARADVLRARAKAAGERVTEQQSFVLEVGSTVRRNFAHAAHQILQTRQVRIRQTFDALLAPQLETGLMFTNDELAKVSRPFREAMQFLNAVRVNGTMNSEQELDALRKLPRIWFDRLKVFVDIESQVQLVG